ncbi:MAG: hypothetical protein NTZ33_15900 [Bacteroidetes bacterium]|nr:hypothetical protein [Bacteroidota bacterium]
MKTKYFTIAVLAVALLGFSCKKDTVTNTTTPPVNSSAALTYNDGTAVAVDSANAVLYSTTPMGSSVMQREIDVYAFKGGMQVLEFHFLPKSGSQPVAQDFYSAWLTYITNNGMSGSDYYNGVSGNFNLTTCDTIANKLVGTFSFTGNNGTANKSITAGTININGIKRQ